MIKSGRGGHHNCPRACEPQQVLKMNLVHGCFPWNKEKTPPLLERHICRTREEIVRHAVGDCARRLHRAGQDDHRIHAERSACDCRTHVRIRVENIDAPRNLLHRHAALVVQHALSAVRHDSVHLDALFPQNINQSNGVYAAARARDADNNLFHRMTVTPPIYGTSAFGTRTEPSAC